jgi:hypothetical protein
MPHHAKDDVDTPIDHDIDHLVHQGGSVFRFFDADVNAIRAQFNRVGGDGGIVICRWRGPGVGLVFPGVPGANDVSILQEAIA